ncbi:MAG: YlbF family regulator [Clostridia bacterium]|nr:YlbF family regulator [Clostridia bacterium]
MDYVEAASLLGSSIALSGEFQAWKEAEAALVIDPKAQTLIKEYKDLQVRMVEGSRQDLAKEELERIRDTLMAKQQQLNEYEVTKNYFDAKKGFENMMSTVNDIIQHYLEDGGGCTGSCQTCGGCQ